MNSVNLTGRLGNDPEIKKTQEGKEFATFSLATSKYWKDKNTGEKKQQTQWHNIIVWGGLVNVVKFLEKGKETSLQGEIDYMSWEGEKGEKKYKTQIVAKEITLIGGKKEITASNIQPLNSSELNSKEEDEELLPF